MNTRRALPPPLVPHERPLKRMTPPWSDVGAYMGDVPRLMDMGMYSDH